MEYYANNDYRDYLSHYGILGMHWGIRRFQPYSVHPRKGGEGGKETGEAKKKGSGSVDAKLFKKRLYQKKDGSLTVFGKRRAALAKNGAYFAKEKAKADQAKAKEYGDQTLSKEHHKKYIDSPNGAKRWLNDMYGPDDWHDKKYMKDVFEVDDVYRHAKDSINSEQKWIEDHEKYMYKKYVESGRQWEKQAYKFLNTPVSELTYADMKIARKVISSRGGKRTSVKIV